jgi:hypothetical protein
VSSLAATTPTTKEAGAVLVKVGLVEQRYKAVLVEGYFDTSLLSLATDVADDRGEHLLSVVDPELLRQRAD